jgi:hypothetical protein
MHRESAYRRIGDFERVAELFVLANNGGAQISVGTLTVEVETDYACRQVGASSGSRVMRAIIGMLGIALLLGDAARAEPIARNLRTGQKHIVLAQSFCAVCKDNRTYCVIKCNGSGICIQNCDNDYRLCAERACAR